MAVTMLGFSLLGARIGIVKRDDGTWRVAQEKTPDHDLAFGPARYGGTHEEAERDARRLAGKWDAEYIGELPCRVPGKPRLRNRAATARRGYVT